MAQEPNQFMESLALREEFRERYSLQRDPIQGDRLLWRAQSLRHMAHLLPGATILELGAGSNAFTKHLHNVSRGENPITAVSFHPLDRFQTNRGDVDPSICTSTPCLAR